MADSGALRRGRAINIRNAVVAVLCGGAPAGALAYRHFPPPWMWVFGLAAGLLWANFFEYALHRWILHWAGTYAGDGHLLHHASIGMANEPLYVNLGGRPVWVVVIFVVNGAPVILADHLLNVGFAPGMMAAFSLYFIITEEVHWRFHMGGWLPGLLQNARARHMAHHRYPDHAFSIFFPVFDLVLGTDSRGHR